MNVAKKKGGWQDRARVNPWNPHPNSALGRASKEEKKRAEQRKREHLLDCAILEGQLKRLDPKRGLGVGV